MINKIGLILGIVGLILSIVWGTLYYNNIKRIKEVMSKAEQDIATIEKSSRAKQDSILLEIKKRDSTIGNLQLAQKKDKEALKEAVKESGILAVSLKKAKANKDTADYYAKCDSLAEKVVVLEAYNESYQNKVDLLNVTYTKQLASKDSLIESKDRLYSELREAFNGSKFKINELTADKVKLEQKLQRSRRTSKFLVVLGAGLAGTVYMTTR